MLSDDLNNCELKRGYYMKRINIIEFLIKSIKMFKDIEEIVVYDENTEKYYKIDELYHMYNNEKQYVVIGIK